MKTEPKGYSQWVAEGKRLGFHDYYKEMVEIALIKSSEPKSDEQIVAEFSRLFVGNVDLDIVPLTPAEDFRDWLRTTLAVVRRKERIACIQQIEQMRDQPLTQRDARDICNLIVNVLSPTQDDTNLST